MDTPLQQGILLICGFRGRHSEAAEGTPGNPTKLQGHTRMYSPPGHWAQPRAGLQEGGCTTAHTPRRPEPHGLHPQPHNDPLSPAGTPPHGHGLTPQPLSAPAQPCSSSAGPESHTQAPSALRVPSQPSPLGKAAASPTGYPTWAPRTLHPAPGAAPRTLTHTLPQNPACSLLLSRRDLGLPGTCAAAGCGLTSFTPTGHQHCVGQPSTGPANLCVPLPFQHSPDPSAWGGHWTHLSPVGYPWGHGSSRVRLAICCLPILGCKCTAWRGTAPLPTCKVQQAKTPVGTWISSGV